MPGFSGCHGCLDGFIIAHFTEKNHVRTLAEGGAQRNQVTFRICTDFSLADDAFVMSVQIFKRILQGDDMAFPGMIDTVYDTCQSGGFSASGRTL